MYADDTTVCALAIKPADLTAILNSELKFIGKWSLENKLSRGASIGKFWANASVYNNNLAICCCCLFCFSCYLFDFCDKETTGFTPVTHQ